MLRLNTTQLGYCRFAKPLYAYVSMIWFYVTLRYYMRSVIDIHISQINISAITNLMDLPESHSSMDYLYDKPGSHFTCGRYPVPVCFGFKQTKKCKS